MPNRIIKESICTSERLSELSDFEFRLWVGLLVSTDDVGRGDARPKVLKGKIFSLVDRVSAEDVEFGLLGLKEKGCIDLYWVGQKPYFCFPNWSSHQRIRDVKPKYPGPDEADVVSGWPEAQADGFSPKSDWPTFSRGFSSLEHSAADCGELRQIAADCGLNPNPNPNPNPSNNNTIGQPAKASRPKEPYSDLFFVKFWETYPRKEKKLNAWKAWEKLKVDKDLSGTIIHALEAWKKCDQWQDVKFIPHPATFLNARQWEDVPTIVKSREELEAEEEERKRRAFAEADFEEECYAE